MRVVLVSGGHTRTLAWHSPKFKLAVIDAGIKQWGDALLSRATASALPPDVRRDIAAPSVNLRRTRATPPYGLARSLTTDITLRAQPSSSGAQHGEAQPRLTSGGKAKVAVAFLSQRNR